MRFRRGHLIGNVCKRRVCRLSMTFVGRRGQEVQVQLSQVRLTKRVADPFEKRGCNRSGGPPFKRALRQLAIGYGAAGATYLLGMLFGTSL